MTAVYNRLLFKTELEARWAAFFDLAGWKWHSNPVPVKDWSPDFRVTFDCSHSECNGSHTLLVAVMPYSKIESFDSHPCLAYGFGGWIPENGGIGLIPEDGGAAFGTNPSVTKWEIAHGSGGGFEDVSFRVPDANSLWDQTKSLVHTEPKMVG